MEAVFRQYTHHDADAVVGTLIQQSPRLWYVAVSAGEPRELAAIPTHWDPTHLSLYASHPGDEVLAELKALDAERRAHEDAARAAHRKYLDICNGLTWAREPVPVKEGE